MPVKSRKKNGGSANGMTAKQMKRKKPLNSDILTDIEPLTENQRIFFEEYAKDKNMFGYGCAGTGKTFIALYLALKDVLSEETPYEKVYICLLYTSDAADE